MKYSISILRRAQKELADLSEKNYRRVKNAIVRLGDNPRPSGSKKLIAREGWRIRSGNFRIIYEIDDREQKILILHIGHRKDIYK